MVIGVTVLRLVSDVNKRQPITTLDTLHFHNNLPQQYIIQHVHHASVPVT